MQDFSLLIKPTGSDCNIDCEYCFYKNRNAEIGQGKQRMSDEVLEKMTKDYLNLRLRSSSFAWQGGEPTLMGLDFYKKVVELQKKYALSTQPCVNTLQTNGILLDDQWCQFLKENNFLVGISVDGPEKFHDHYRKNFAGKGTHARVMRSIELCKKYGVEHNVLILLNRINADDPDAIFDFFVEKDIRYLQYIPCVEVDPATGQISDFSVTPQQYGNFLCRLLDRWLQFGPDKISIRDFDSIISYCLNGHHTICTFDQQCSGYIVIEHSGDAFCCDFFVTPEWKLGNIFETPIGKLAASSRKRTFARQKKKLAAKCTVCRFLDVCRGGCMKDRAPFNKNDFAKESYFCESYKQFFDYALPKFMNIAASLT